MRKIISYITIITVLLLLYSCQDDEITNSENLTSSKKINLWRFPAEQIFKNKPNVKSKIDKLKKENLQARLTSSVYDFSIEENEVQVIFGENYTQYTFEVSRNNTNNDILENYICKVFNDGTINQFLVTYPKLIDSQGNIHFDATNSSINLIDDQDLIVSQRTNRTGFPSGCVPELINESWDYVCENIPCTGYGHTVGQDCDCGVTTDCEVAHTECSWVQTMVYGCGGGGGTGDDSSNDDSGLPQGGNSSSGNDNTVDEIIAVPFQNKNHIKNCEELAIDSQNQVFKDRMQSLEDNIDGTIEKSFGLYNGNYATPAISNPSCSVLFDGDGQNAGSIPYHISLKGTAHNHLKDSIHNHIGTFSPNDLLGLSNIIAEQEAQNSPVQIQEFVAYLVSNEGNYAFKVNNFDKLYNFIFMYTTNTTFKDVVNNFYKDNKIRHGKPKQDQNIGFLKMIQKFDVGIDYYESDENFQNWEKLELNTTGNDIVKTPC
jgi:hypothetical protein